MLVLEVGLVLLGEGYDVVCCLAELIESGC